MRGAFHRLLPIRASDSFPSPPLSNILTKTPLEAPSGVSGCQQKGSDLAVEFGDPVDEKFKRCPVAPTLNHWRPTRIASDGRFSFNNRGLRAAGWGSKGLAHLRSIGPELPQLISLSAHTEFKSRSHCPQVACANHQSSPGHRLVQKPFWSGLLLSGFR
jgi:hypothetical protein